MSESFPDRPDLDAPHEPGSGTPCSDQGAPDRGDDVARTVPAGDADAPEGNETTRRVRTDQVAAVAVVFACAVITIVAQRWWADHQHGDALIAIAGVAAAAVLAICSVAQRRPARHAQYGLLGATLLLATSGALMLAGTVAGPPSKFPPVTALARADAEAAESCNPVAVRLPRGWLCPRADDGVIKDVVTGDAVAARAIVEYPGLAAADVAALLETLGAYTWRVRYDADGRVDAARGWDASVGACVTAFRDMSQRVALNTSHKACFG